MSVSGFASNDDQGRAADSWLHVLASRHFPDWLARQQVSLGITTYQPGKLLLLGHKPDQSLAVFERTLNRCMGLCAAPDAETLWLSSRFQLWRLENMLPEPRDTLEFDRLYVPRVGYTTGDIDVHDLAVAADSQVIFVNTLFSCLATISERYNFEVVWRPPFITRLAAEDRCHLNGLALRDGQARYVTFCGRTDVVDGWRDCRTEGGCVLDITTNNVLVEGLSMPHSPRWYGDRLWLLEAGAGWLGYVDTQGRFERVTFCGGYPRGLAIVDHYAVVGLSLSRHEPTFAVTLSTKEATKLGDLSIKLSHGEIVDASQFFTRQLEHLQEHAGHYATGLDVGIGACQGFQITQPF